MRALRYWPGTATLLTTVVGIATAQAPAPDPSTRMVLVELYTSQGCDMCPAAESMLGALAEQDRRIVPIAFHVDYFDDPWKDEFSDPQYSRRQMAYNRLYTVLSAHPGLNISEFLSPVGSAVVGRFRDTQQPEVVNCNGVSSIVNTTAGSVPPFTQ